MSAPTFSPQAAAPANAVAIGALIAERGGKRAGDGADSGFASVLQEFAAKDHTPSSRAGAERAKGDSTKSALAEDDAASDGTQQPRLASDQPALNGAAALAAIVSPPAAALAASLTPNLVLKTDPGARAAATQFLAARLRGQIGASQTSTADDATITPSEATPSLALATTMTASPSVVEAHVQRARTYLAVDGVAQAAKIAADSGQTAADTTGASASSTLDGRPTSGATAHHDQSSGSWPGAGEDKRSGASDAGVTQENGALAVNDLASATSAIGTSSIDVDQLADIIADQAQALVGPSAAAASGSTSATPVKELDVQLNPADLGTLTVKMRLANGALAVVIEASKGSTAKLIEGERDAISERLAAVDQPLASITVKASESVANQSENGNASSSANTQQGGAQSGATGGSDGQSRSSRGADPQEKGGAASPSDDEASHRARLGDLFV